MLNILDQFDTIQHKLIAILRGIEEKDIEHVIPILIEAGFQMIEIPLNSPTPFASIEKAARVAKKHPAAPFFIGAGTVLTSSDVDKVHEAGGNFVVSPNVDEDVIKRTIHHNMFSMAGVFTATEAHAALKHGTHCLKFFPASILGANGIQAITTILPKQTHICAVGGIDASDFSDYYKKGIRIFGLGSSLYKPSMSYQDVKDKSHKAISTYQQMIGE